jgi:hypothetical protein
MIRLSNSVGCSPGLQRHLLFAIDNDYEFACKGNTFEPNSKIKHAKKTPHKAGQTEKGVPRFVV